MPKVDWRTQRGAPCEGGLPADCSREGGGGLCLEAILADCVFFSSFLTITPFIFVPLLFPLLLLFLNTLQDYFRLLFSFSSAALVILILFFFLFFVDQSVLYSVVLFYFDDLIFLNWVDDQEIIFYSPGLPFSVSKARKCLK